MGSWRFIFGYWLRSKKKFITAFILQLIAVFLAVLIPMRIGRLVASIAYGIPDTAFIWQEFGIISVLAILSYFFARTSRIKGVEVSSAAVYYLRKDINDTIHSQSYSFFDKYETGQLVARATSDVEQTQMIFNFGLGVGLQSAVQLIGVFTVSFVINTIMGIIITAVTITALYTIYRISQKLRPIYIRTRMHFGALTNTIRENIIGAKIVRIFSKQSKEKRKFDNHNRAFYKESVRSVKWNSMMNPVTLFFIGLLGALIIIIGGFMVIDGRLALEKLIAFQGYVGILMFPLGMFGQIMLFYIQADAALVRIREILDSVPDIMEPEDAIPMPDIKGDVEFRHVYFGYIPSRPILKDVSFKVNAGEKIVILGPTGSGKSTIINLLPRFYDVTSGEILIDGVDVRRIKLRDLRRQIGIVAQETFLFNKSIKENITFGVDREVSMEEIIEAAKAAEIHDFITSLPDGYNTIVGERGTRLSGGQKQRLTIARALIKKPKILIFDDSTSSVDVETEYKIQKALEKIMEGTTSFVITQRVSSIRTADKILLLDNGRVVGFGKHEELLKSNPLYRQIFGTLYRMAERNGLPAEATGVLK